MTKYELKVRTDREVALVKDALETLRDALPPGQQKQVVKDEKVKALFDLYGVEYNA